MIDQLEVRARPATRPLWASRQLYILLFALNAAVVVGFWWASTGAQPMRSLGDVLNAIGRITGLLGTYLVLWQLLLMTRQPWLDAAFGLDKLARIHRWNGYLALGLLLAHAVFQTLGYQLSDGMSTFAQLGDFVNAYEGLLPAIVGLLLLVIVVGISITVARRRLAYETWYFVHLYTYLGIALAFAHEIAVGADFIANRAFTVYFCALYVAVLGCLIGFRVVLPLVRYNRHRFKVQRVQREGPNVVSVYVGGRNLDALPTRAGQFMLWRFLDRGRWWQAHPFSLSLPPNRRHLRLTVKNIGDFTARIASVRPGTPVLLEGPFGSFTARSCSRPRALLIAGGIGITPLRPLAQELASRGVDVCLLYRCRREQDVVLRDELDELAASPRVRVSYVFSDRRGPRGGRPNPLGPSALRRVVPDLAQREVYVCGPAAMTEAVVGTLRSMGVGSEQIHTEAFRL